MISRSVVVVGQFARDLVLLVDEVPPAGSSADASLRREVLGGKGANQAVALAQLGAAPALVAVRGDDRIGEELLAQAQRDGIDVAHVVRRDGTPTGLIVEVLDSGGGWRYLQHLPEPVLLTVDDVEAAAETLRAADAVLVQLQQPAPAALAAARLGRAGGALVVLDGVPPEGGEELLRLADVVRADEHETELLTGATEPDGIRAAVQRIEGPRMFAFGLADGNFFMWRDDAGSHGSDDAGGGELRLPLSDEKVVDTTGGGDAFTAALTVALLRGDAPGQAARYAVAASAATVGHPGGRPQLSDADLRVRAAAG